MNVARLREQLEVARALGLVDVSPRTGIRRREYSFFPTVQQSLSYAIELNRDHFDKFADLRNHIESAYWYEAVQLLTQDDLAELERLFGSAWDKLHHSQIQIPHFEHRQMHLLIYSRLENPFIHGILEAYWDAYEAVGLNLYTGIEYLKEVWQYHQAMIHAIRTGHYQDGYRALVEHKDLLYHRLYEKAEHIEIEKKIEK
jgi:DNA-binding FadR family transcriptional regulator